VQTAQTGTTQGANLDGAITMLVSNMHGAVIQPGDEGYDAARTIFNGMIDRHPRLIARCTEVADVVNAVNSARTHGMTLSVRGGGHNVAGSCMNDGGIVVDLSGLRGVHVDAEARTVRAEGGATWADVDQATHAFGLAAPGGLVSTTGVGGLTLGGGLGHLTRAHGLSIDNLVAAEVVLADGSTVTASAEEHHDLFWALRGGGGNFGVVTAFTFRLHPVGIVYGGPVIYPAEMAGDLLRLYRDFIDRAPDELSAFFAYLIVPPGPPFPEHLHGKTMCALVACYTGPLEQGEEAVRPLREFGPPALDMMGPIPFPVLQSLFDPLAPFGLQQYWKADFVAEITDAMIDIHTTYGPQLPTLPSIVHIYPVSGAASRVGAEETAYAHRDAKFVHIIGAAYPDPAETPQHIAWVRDYWNALRPHAAGAYVNFLMDEGEERIRTTYGGNLARLAAVKRQYDPTNLFRMNQNIKPAS
jgi:FAD/FMN-containing dehydrogenase